MHAPRFHKTESVDVADRAAAAVLNVSDPAGTPVWVDVTTAFNSATNADTALLPASEAIGDYVVFGAESQFQSIKFDYLNGTAGVGGTGIWEYWDGLQWVALTGVTDATAGFTTAAADGLVVDFDWPVGWKKRSLNGSAQLYFVRFRVLTVYSTNPVIDQGFITGDHKIGLKCSALYVGAAGTVVCRHGSDEFDRTYTIATAGLPAYLWGDFWFVRATSSATGIVAMQEEP